MRHRILSFTAAALVLLPAAHAQTSTPDLSGVFTRSGGGGARNPMSEWSAEALPFTPEGLARFNANKPGKGPRQVPPALGNDPLGDSNPPGLYRTLIYNRPFEMVQTPGKVVQLFEWAKIWRVIWTDGRPIPDNIPAGPYWYGYSVGKWEGDTLVVQTLGLDDRAWLDEWGTPFSDDARIEERWKRTSPDKIELTITVHDPATYAKAWTSSPVVYSAQRKTEVLEMIFAPIDEKEFNKRVRDPAAGVGKK
jgi:hypothetical protein